jgi:MYXO-CTERM domain-containing protein
VRSLPLVFLVACSSGLEKYEGDTASHDLESGVTPGETGPIDSAEDGNHAPVADAGDDQEALVGQIVELDGSGSSDADGDALDYTWTLDERPSGSSTALINASFADPQFIPDAPGTYRISLVVSDGAVDSAADTVTVTAAEQNGVPVANAGPDQTVTPGQTIYLDASGSTDPDGDSLQYAWTLTSRPGGSSAALIGPTSVAPTFVADLAGTYEASLTVFDGANYSSPDQVRITANDPGGTDTGGGCGCHTGAEGGLGGFLLAGVALLALRRR